MNTTPTYVTPTPPMPLPLTSPTEQLDDILQRVCVTLQLTDTQYRLAGERYKAVGDWLDAPDSPLFPWHPHIYPQGSLLVGTTVRPMRQQEYDLDLVCQFVADWRSFPNPVVLLDLIEARLLAHGTYRTMIARKNRCICLNYANDFHLDILPACPDDRVGGTAVRVPDRKLQAWKESNPKGYGRWFEDAAALSLIKLEARRQDPLPNPEAADAKPPLKLAVQLLKRWRDVAFDDTPEYAPTSIVLTTLSGHAYQGADSVAAAVDEILAGIIRVLPPPPQRLRVLNPANPLELLSECWEKTPGAYDRFVLRLHQLRRAWVDLRETRGLAPITDQLRPLFGGPLSESAVRAHVERLEEARGVRQLGILPGSGVLAPAAAAGARAIRPNTFYGG